MPIIRRAKTNRANTRDARDTRGRQLTDAQETAFAEIERLAKKRKAGKATSASKENDVKKEAEAYYSQTAKVLMANIEPEKKKVKRSDRDVVYERIKERMDKASRLPGRLSNVVLFPTNYFTSWSFAKSFLNIFNLQDTAKISKRMSVYLGSEPSEQKLRRFLNKTWTDVDKLPNALSANGSTDTMFPLFEAFLKMCRAKRSGQFYWLGDNPRKNTTREAAKIAEKLLAEYSEPEVDSLASVQVKLKRKIASSLGKREDEKYKFEMLCALLWILTQGVDINELELVHGNLTRRHGASLLLTSVKQNKKYGKPPGFWEEIIEVITRDTVPLRKYVAVGQKVVELKGKKIAKSAYYLSDAYWFATDAVFTTITNFLADVEKGRSTSGTKNRFIDDAAEEDDREEEEKVRLNPGEIVKGMRKVKYIDPEAKKKNRK